MLVEDELVEAWPVDVDVDVDAGAAAVEVLWLDEEEPEEPHPLAASASPTALAAASALTSARILAVIVVSRMIPFLLCVHFRVTGAALTPPGFPSNSLPPFTCSEPHGRCFCPAGKAYPKRPNIAGRCSCLHILVQQLLASQQAPHPALDCEASAGVDPVAPSALPSSTQRTTR